MCARAGGGRGDDNGEAENRTGETDSVAAFHALGSAKEAGALMPSEKAHSREIAVPQFAN